MTWLQPPHAVLFDFYNTLGVVADSGYAHLVGPLRRHGYAVPTQRLQAALSAAWRPYDGAEPIAHLEHSRDEAAYERWRERIERDWLARAGIDPCPEGLLREICRASDAPEAYRFFDDALPVLRELRCRGYRMAVVSNWGWWLEAILEREGALPLLDAVVTSARSGYRKPHPEIYRMALAALDLPAHDALFVGDNPHADVDGPRTVGMQALLIDRGGGRRGAGCITGLHALLDLLPERAPGVATATEASGR